MRTQLGIADAEPFVPRTAADVLGRAQQKAPEMGRVGAKAHRELVRAIQDRDAARATEIMRQHLGRTARRVKNL